MKLKGKIKRILTLFTAIALLLGLTMQNQQPAFAATGEASVNISVKSGAGDGRMLYDGHTAQIDLAWSRPAEGTGDSTVEVTLPTYKGFGNEVNLPLHDSSKAYFYWYNGNSKQANAYKKTYTASGGATNIVESDDGSKITFTVPAGKTSGTISVYRTVAVDDIDKGTSRTADFGIKVDGDEKSGQTVPVKVVNPYNIESLAFEKQVSGGGFAPIGNDELLNSGTTLRLKSDWKWMAESGIHQGDILRIKMPSRTYYSGEREGGLGFSISADSISPVEDSAGKIIGTMYVDTKENIMIVFNSGLESKLSVTGNLKVTMNLYFDNIDESGPTEYHIEASGKVLEYELPVEKPSSGSGGTITIPGGNLYKNQSTSTASLSAGKNPTWTVGINRGDAYKYWDALRNGTTPPVNVLKHNAFIEDEMKDGLALKFKVDSTHQSMFFTKVVGYTEKNRDISYVGEPFTSVCQLNEAKASHAATFQKFVEYLAEEKGVTTRPLFWDTEGNEYAYHYEEDKFYLNDAGAGLTPEQMDSDLSIVKFRIQLGDLIDTFDSSKVKSYTLSHGDAGFTDDLSFAEGQSVGEQYTLHYNTKIIDKNYFPEGDYEKYTNTAKLGWEESPDPVEVSSSAKIISNSASATGSTTNIMIYKYQEDFKTPLQGAEFTLFKKDASGNYKAACEPVVSGARGDVWFTNIGIGKYKLQETKAPEGYDRNTQTYEFSVEHSEEKGWIPLTPASGDDQVTVEKSGKDEWDNDFWVNKFANKLSKEEKKTGDLEVEKKVAGNSAPADGVYTFVLMKDNQPVAGAPYGIGENNYTTNDAGEFTLSHGEKAVFKGLETGDNYKVLEKAPSEQKDITLVTSHKIGGKEAVNGRETGAVEITEGNTTAVEFTNTYTKDVGSLEVEKVVKGAEGARPDQDTEFTFVLLKGGKAAADQSYKIGAVTGKTDESGSFKLKAGEKAVFSALDLAEDYTVKEIEPKDSDKVTRETTNTVNQSESQEELVTDEFAVKKGNPVLVIFTNAYEKSEPGGPNEIEKNDPVESIKVTKKVDKKKVKPEDYLTYTLVVENTGKTAVKKATVKDYIPAYTTFISLEKDGEYVRDGDKPYVIWTLNNLKPGQKVQLSFKVQIHKCIPQNHVFKNTALYGTNDSASDDKLQDRTNTVKTDSSYENGDYQPQTGDNHTMILYLALAILAAVIAGGTVFYRRRRHNN